MADLRFYNEHLDETSAVIELDESTSKHVIQVLRLKKGDKISLTNGKGLVASAEIFSDNKRSASAKILTNKFIPQPVRQTCIGISLIKNVSRFEWFLEKATEIGINRIVPLICKRTEKQHFKFSRLQNILVSAMLQSQQAWLPEFCEPVSFEQFVNTETSGSKFIAHCINGEKNNLTQGGFDQKSVVLIGPEGDFTEDEVNLAIKKDFIPVTLGNTRLRTETAGIVAAALINWQDKKQSTDNSQPQ